MSKKVATKEAPKIVTIAVHGGVVEVEDVPPGVKVVIRDFDVDGSEDERQGDEYDEYTESIYEG
jgi:hypothetical protein